MGAECGEERIAERCARPAVSSSRALERTVNIQESTRSGRHKAKAVYFSACFLFGICGSRGRGTRRAQIAQASLHTKPSLEMVCLFLSRPVRPHLPLVPQPPP